MTQFQDLPDLWLEFDMHIKPRVDHSARMLDILADVMKMSQGDFDRIFDRSAQQFILIAEMVVDHCCGHTGFAADVLDRHIPITTARQQVERTFLSASAVSRVSPYRRGRPTFVFKIQLLVSGQATIATFTAFAKMRKGTSVGVDS